MHTHHQEVGAFAGLNDQSLAIGAILSELLVIQTLHPQHEMRWFGRS